MKKLLAALVAILLLFGGFLFWNGNKAPETPAVQTPAAAEETAPDSLPTEAPADAEPEAARSLDYEAIKALHAPDTVVLRVAEREIRWDEYFDWLQTNCRQIEDYFAQMAAYYGMSADWEGSVGDGTGRNFLQYAVAETTEYLASNAGIRAFAAAQGIELSEEERAALAPEALAARLVGEGATEEDLVQLLDSEMHMTLDAFLRMTETNSYYAKCGVELYGENGEKVEEEDAVAWLEEQGYLSAGHILLMTIDPNTGDTLDAELLDQKNAKAKEIYEELAAIEDREALLRRFAELKEANCEDGGKAVYPDGYTFTPGTMVTEFEDAVRSLEEYGVSTPVQTSYGLHIILRLPLSGDSLLYSAQGAPSTARQQYAVTSLSERLDAFLAEHETEKLEGIDTLDLAPYLK